MKISLSEYYQLLGPYFARFKKVFGISALLLLISIALQVIAPQYMKRFIDQAMGGAAISSVIFAAILFLVLNIFQQIISIGATYSGQSLAWLATNELRVDLARHCLNLDMDFHNNKLKGELIERLDGDISKLGEFFARLLIMVVGNLVLMICVLAIIFWENWMMGIAITLTSAFSLFIINRTRNIAIEPQRRYQQVIADLYGYLEERLASTEDIRALGAVNFILNGFYRISRRYKATLWDVHKKIIIIGSISNGVITLMNIVTFTLCFYLFYYHSMSLGTVFMITFYVNVLTVPIKRISDQVQSLQGVGASVARTRELLDTTPKIKDGNRTLIPDQGYAIEFKRVDFSYVENSPILQNVSFSLGENKVLGVIGRTGSGKTTLTRLLFRLYETNQGEIRIGGHDIKDLTLRSLRESVAMVTQDIQLFRATVRENLTFFNPDISDSQIMDALKHLRLVGWFQKLPDGLDTVLNTGNTGLSAGEAQLLAFTRVFLKDPKIIILDEASSRLDPATENLLDQAVQKLIQNRSVIIVAHRLQTIEKADSILLLENGEVTEFGDRARLKSDPISRFAKILKTGLEEELS